MRDSTAQHWQTTLTRWGDAVFGLALLVTDDRTAAEQATVRAFTQYFAASTDGVEDVLFRSLLQQRPRRLQPQAWMPQRWQRHAIPESLTRIAPLDRLLLALWLLHGIDSARLASVAQIEQATLPQRLVIALLKISEPTSTTEPSSLEALTGWVSQLLVGHRGKLIQFQAAETDKTRGWITLVETARTVLRTTIGHRRLPLGCIDTIMAEAYTQVEGTTQWWHRRPVWIGAVLTMVSIVLLLIIKPWSSGALASSEPQPSPVEIVQQTIDSWTTLPTSGTLHSRVWAKPQLTTSDEPLVTDVWLSATSEQHRVEVRQGDKLVEWQVADGRRRFEHAGQPYVSACRWAAPIALDRRIRSFQVPSTDIAAARDARLKLGAYGVGYQILQQALTAKDLRSFGTRIEGNTALMALTYTDTTGLYDRRMLLWIDPKAKELRLVQVLTGAKDGSAGRDLWRLQVREQPKNGVPLERPEWTPPIHQRDRLLDPACPGLDANHVISLRTTITRPSWWYQHLLPTVLPSGITDAAVLNATSLSSQTNDPNNIHTVFIGSGRWLQLRFTTHTDSNTHRGQQYDDWKIAFDEQARMFSGTACQIRSNEEACFPSLSFIAHGWSKDEIVAMIKSLKPVDAQLWQQYDTLFLDPQPLSAEVKDVLLRAWESHQPQSNALYLKAKWTARVEPERRVLDDPYHIPLHIQFPQHLYHEQWFAYAAGDVVQYKELMTLTDGTLHNSQTNNGKRVDGYDIRNGTANQSLINSANWWFSPPQSPTDQVVKHLLTSPATIDVDRSDGVIQLMQLQQTDVQPDPDNLIRVEMDPFAGPLVPWLGDLPSGSYRYSVWLNESTYLPMRAVTTFIDERGRETELASFALIEWQPQAALPVDTWTPPALPSNTIVFDSQEPPNISPAREAGNLFVMERALIWPEQSGFVQRIDNNPRIDDDKDAGFRSRFYQAVWTPLQQLDQHGVLKITTYDLPGIRNRLVVRQGPRLLLRHALRHNPLTRGLSQHQMWESSTAVAVTIDGKLRTAWLIKDSFDIQSLVVEVDDVLLHITGSDPQYIEQDVPNLLSQMVWVELPK